MTSKSVKEAIAKHNKFVKEQLEKAKNGETINLTDLMISKQEVEDKILNAEDN